MSTPTPAHMALPWKVMPCPDNAGKHPFHDNRWIATEDAHVERGHDPRSWGLESGSLICEMRDGPPANAALIVRACNAHQALVDALRGTLAMLELLNAPGTHDPIEARVYAARAALKLATEGTR